MMDTAACPDDSSQPASVVEVRRLQAHDRVRWDAFVKTCPEATFFHRAGWQTMMEQGFGHDSHFLYAEQAGRISGVLPLAHIRSRIFGNTLISLPFCVYGGIASSNNAARQALDAAAQTLAQQLQVGHLEYRQREHPDGLKAMSDGWLAKPLYATFRRRLHADEQDNLLAIPRKQRAVVRKGIAADLHGSLDDDLGRFFPLYAASVHRLGTPVFARRHFALLRNVFGDDCQILTVSQGRQAHASVMTFYFRDEVLPYYAGGSLLARDTGANDFMYWELMRRASARGYRWFDFGRSKLGTGAYGFKKNWGFVAQPLPYAYKLVAANALPDTNPLNPKYRYFIRAWQRLPLPLANLLGPHIVRQLG